MKYILPKPYLSYSAIELWRKNPDGYRQKYYYNIEQPVTPELSFGKKIAELLEVGDASMAHIKRYPVSEQKIDCIIDDVPIFGFIDSFDPNTNAFLEYKTGKTPWTKSRVEGHLQLDIYSVCIEQIFGSVVDECELIWMETERVEKIQTGRISHENAYGIRLTGKVASFPRVITAAERKYTRLLLTDVAQQIHDDYAHFLKEKDMPKIAHRGRL